MPPPAEAAVRFAIGHRVAVRPIGMATPAGSEDALTAVNKGPLPRAA
jgi:hypothetical protein